MSKQKDPNLLKLHWEFTQWQLKMKSQNICLDHLILVNVLR